MTARPAPAPAPARGTSAPVIAPEDPRTPDVRALLTRHLQAMHAQSPPEDVHALDVDALAAPHVTFLAARDADGTLLGVGALARITPGHAEIKSMHTAAAARRRGVAAALLDRLLALAAEQGDDRVSLETGTQDGFAAARALYERAGFVACPPFAAYRPSPSSAFYTRLTPPR
ncbi:GNAT family N-acetyltransferase [Cellulomonas sp. ES6]|uniref:GNAT family N-acetyltransferase n=1 Tax=Cellulomonas sp. ES6 TaxID=3039384 RepID=UPI0024B84637|nr:GNAT family N-acetyltransferase [Cellulomonas sp. ES6]WHP15984.1 GNAT family N-acetyltransferase [Cellulomonas sp. ES6]